MKYLIILFLISSVYADEAMIQAATSGTAGSRLVQVGDAEIVVFGDDIVYHKKDHPAMGIVLTPATLVNSVSPNYVDFDGNAGDVFTNAVNNDGIKEAHSAADLQ